MSFPSLNVASTGSNGHGQVARGDKRVRRSVDAAEVGFASVTQCEVRVLTRGGTRTHGWRRWGEGGEGGGEGGSWYR